MPCSPRSPTPAGVIAQHIGALERASFVLTDWRATKRRLTEVQARMVDVLDQLELTGLVTTLPGLSAVGAAAMLAETGDLTRVQLGMPTIASSTLDPKSRGTPPPTLRFDE